jgi:hypothetical protein
MPANQKVHKTTKSTNKNMPPTVVNNSASMELSQVPSQALSFEPMENSLKSTDISATNALETSLLSSSSHNSSATVPMQIQQPLNSHVGNLPAADPQQSSLSSFSSISNDADLDNNSNTLIPKTADLVTDTNMSTETITSVPSPPAKDSMENSSQQAFTASLTDTQQRPQPMAT